MNKQVEENVNLAPIERIFIPILLGLSGWYVFRNNQFLGSVIFAVAVVVLLFYPLPFLKKESREIVPIFLLLGAISLMGFVVGYSIMFFALMICITAIATVYLLQVDSIMNFITRRKLPTFILGAVLWWIATNLFFEESYLGMGLYIVTLLTGATLIFASVFQAIRLFLYEEKPGSTENEKEKTKIQ